MPLTMALYIVRGWVGTGTLGCRRLPRVPMVAHLCVASGEFQAARQYAKIFDLPLATWLGPEVDGLPKFCCPVVVLRAEEAKDCVDPDCSQAPHAAGTLGCVSDPTCGSLAVI